VVSFDFVYKDFKVEHPVGDLPQLQLTFDVKVSVGEECAIYVPVLRWTVKLIATGDLENAAGRVIGDWGTFEGIGAAKLFKERRSEEVVCTIPMSSPKMKQLADIRFSGKMPRFDISVDGMYLYYTKQKPGYQLHTIKPFHVSPAKMYYKDKTIKYVNFTTDDINDLLEQIQQYKLVSIDIPVYKGRKPSNELLANAANLLEEAKKDLIAGNHEGVLKNVRDSITLYLMEKKKKEAAEPKKWVMREDITKNFFENVPTRAKKPYDTMWKWIEKEFRTQLRIINDVFMHRDKIKVYPRPEDVEKILFVTAFLIRYLSYCLSPQ
jgi:hypothetical protein